MKKEAAQPDDNELIMNEWNGYISEWKRIKVY